MKIVKPIICVGLVSAMLVGCGTTTKNNVANDGRPMGVRYSPTNNYDGTHHNNRLGMNRDGFGTNVNTRDGYGTNVNNRDGFGTNVNNRDGFGTNVGTNNHNNRVDVADHVADRVAELKEVHSAHVLVTDRNAYVAVKLNGNARNELTRDLDQKIAHKVREADNSIDRVHVSAKPDFYERMHGYRNDLRTGHPVSGFYESFTRTIGDVFPHTRTVR